MSEAGKGIRAASPAGRVLLALRAGAMSSGEITERIGGMNELYKLVRGGLVAGDEYAWRLTDDGRAACPLRNPLSAPAVAPPITQRTQHTGVSLMTTKQKRPAAVDQVRQLLAGSPDGLSRQSILKQTGLSESNVDNALMVLTRADEAYRPRYGVIAARPGLLAARVAVGTLTTAINVSEATPALAKSAPRQVEKEPEPVVRPEPSPETTAIGADAPGIDFWICADGRLEIVDGDEIMSLPPEATRRLGCFLGCLDRSAWPPRMDAAVPR